MKSVAWVGYSRDVAKFTEAVYVLHVFQKKARKTPPADIELARTRYRAMLKERKQR